MERVVADTTPAPEVTPERPDPTEAQAKEPTVPTALVAPRVWMGLGAAEETGSQAELLLVREKADPKESGEADSNLEEVEIQVPPIRARPVGDLQVKAAAMEALVKLEAAEVEEAVALVPAAVVAAEPQAGLAVVGELVAAPSTRVS